MAYRRWESFFVLKDVEFVEKVKGGTVHGKLVWKMRPNRRFRRAQRFIDNEVIKKSDPYTPLQSGALKGSAQANSSIGSGLIQYGTSYARYQYYGHVMAGRAPKHVTGKLLTYQGAPNRGAKWFERMKVKHKSEIMKGAAKIIVGK